MITAWVVLASLALVQGADAQSVSYSSSYSVPGYAPVTYTASSGHASAVAAASSTRPTQPVNYAPRPQQAQFGPRLTRDVQSTLLSSAPAVQEDPKPSLRNDANQQITQNTPPKGLEQDGVSQAAATDANQQMTQKTPPKGLELDGVSQVAATDGPRSKRGYLQYYRAAPVYLRVYPGAYYSSAPAQVYGLPAGSAAGALAQAGAAFAPPTPAQVYGLPAGSNAGASAQAGAVFAPPTPAQVYLLPAGSAAGALTQAGAAFAPPTPAQVYGVPAVSDAGAAFAPPPSSPDHVDGSVATALTEAGAAFAPSPSPSSPEDKTPDDNSAALVDAGAEFVPPVSPEEALGLIAAAPPASEEPSTSQVKEEVSLGAVLAQAAEAFVPPPAPPSVYGLPQRTEQNLRKINKFQVIPLKTRNEEDIIRSLVFVPAFSDNPRVQLPPPAPGAFLPADGALLSPATPIVNNRLLPSPR